MEKYLVNKTDVAQLLSDVAKVERYAVNKTDVAALLSDRVEAEQSVCDNCSNGGVCDHTCSFMNMNW